MGGVVYPIARFWKKRKNSPKAPILVGGKRDPTGGRIGKHRVPGNVYQGCKTGGRPSSRGLTPISDQDQPKVRGGEVGAF